MKQRLVLASGNPHKVAELSAMFEVELPRLEVVGMKSLGAPPIIEETSNTFEGNALLKARGIAAWALSLGEDGGTLVLADDSGIVVDALDGAPGVLSARFAGEQGDDGANNRKLVAELKARGLEASPAHYACVLALVRVDGADLGPVDADSDAGCWADAGAWCLAGRCEGEVRTESRGEGGFGYDPHFWVDGRARTFAELSRSAKASRSHRGVALRLLATRLPALLASERPPSRGHEASGR